MSILYIISVVITTSHHKKHVSSILGIIAVDESIKMKAQSGRGKIQGQVLARLRYGIMAGLFVPGQTMSLRKLADLLGTSAMPVRESLNRLVAANALEELPNRTVRVPVLDENSLVQLFEVRRMVEGMAARLAAEKATSELCARLKAINEKGKKAHNTGAMAEVLMANQEFHFAIYRSIESDILPPIIEGLWLRCGPTMYFSLNSPDLWDTSSHIDILKSMATKNPSAAEIAMQNDIMKTGNYLINQARHGHTVGPIANLGKIDAAI